jgi:hypothetical protein
MSRKKPTPESVKERIDRIISELDDNGQGNLFQLVIRQHLPETRPGAVLANPRLRFWKLLLAPLLIETRKRDYRERQLELHLDQDPQKLLTTVDPKTGKLESDKVAAKRLGIPVDPETGKPNTEVVKARRWRAKKRKEEAAKKAALPPIGVQLP